MYKKANLLFMICESPLHAGSGSDMDFIDNPIQRERHTGYPKIESSSLKGALRERFADELGQTHSEVITGFGPDKPAAGDEKQGCLGFSDARLLLFPVKSMRGVFVWITCPRVLKRLEDDLRKVDGQQGFRISGLVEPGTGEALVFPDNQLTIKNSDNRSNIILEEFAFSSRDDAQTKAGSEPINVWLANKIFPVSDADRTLEYWNGLLKTNLVILTDDDFADFAELSTEVITRNKINPKTGTVQKGALFIEEYLPADSVLYSLVLAHPEFVPSGGRSADEILSFFETNLSSKFNHAFQAGGNATIGKGLIRTTLMNPAPVLEKATT